MEGGPRLYRYRTQSYLVISRITKLNFFSRNSEQNYQKKKRRKAKQQKQIKMYEKRKIFHIKSEEKITPVEVANGTLLAPMYGLMIYF